MPIVFNIGFFCKMQKFFQSFYKKVGWGEWEKCKYPTRLDTYWQWCGHNCDYCYARALLDFRGLWHPLEPLNIDVEKARKVIEKIPEWQITRLWGMTDCFQPVEKQRWVTYEVLKEMNKNRKWYLIVTKSDLVADDKYIEVLDKDLAHIQITITSTDDNIALKYEHATKTSDRIKAIEKLWSLWYDVQIRLSPYIIPYVDVDIINNIKCDKIIVEFLRVNHWIKKWFDIDYSEYIVKEWGYLHLPLEKKREYLSRIKKKEISVCEDVMWHYNFWRQSVNVNKDDCCNLRK